MNLGGSAKHELIPCHSVYFYYIKCNYMCLLGLSNGHTGEYKSGKLDLVSLLKTAAHMKPLLNSNRPLKVEL